MHSPAFRRILTNGWMKIKLIGSKVKKNLKPTKTLSAARVKYFGDLQCTHMHKQ